MTSSVYTAQIQFLCNDHITPFPSNIMKFTHAIFNSFCFRIRQPILHSVYYCVPQNIIALHAPFIPYLPSISLPPEVDIYFCVPRRDKKRLLNSQIYANASVPLAENMQETKKTYPGFSNLSGQVSYSARYSCIKRPQSNRQSH
jgi:hypothetical protein